MELVIEPTMMPLTVDAQGVVRIGKSRVVLEAVVYAFVDGATAEEIALQYPSLELADIYATIAYYLHHKTQIDAYLQQRDALAKQVQTRIEAANNPVGVRARLLARRQNKQYECSEESEWEEQILYLPLRYSS